ncbi:LOW QUALITY PROTEIN: hypothetical protein U9M48_036317 [Paspalum notatum var. saurae]|uniref:Uncharacterized protein n=1 Tax=Paspalum notatum var. saurae TaxID=547442 RepID=A0AAQ3UH90_PASNO
MSDTGPLSFYPGIEVHRDDSGSHFDGPPTPSASLSRPGSPIATRLSLRWRSGRSRAAIARRRSLRYLVHTRPDLAFSVGYVSRFMRRPTTEHRRAVKRIIRYVAGTLDHGLYYPRCPGEAHLVGYDDGDHGGDIDTGKSTSGILFFLGKCLPRSVKQQVVAAVRLRGRVHSGLHRFNSGPLACSALVRSAPAKNPVFHERSKHIRVRYHFIRDCREEGSIKARYINTKDRLADLLTKPLGRIKFLELRSGTGMVQLSTTYRRTRLRGRMME